MGGGLNSGFRPHLPFDDPGHIAQLEGQRFVVLRPHGEVSRAYSDVRVSVRSRFSRLAVSCPARPHVTVHGFPAGTALAHVQALVRSWATAVPPLRLEMEGVGVFPPPFKTVVVRVCRTPPLVHALASLRDLARQRALPDWPAGVLPSVEDWIFHMSVAYCSALSAEEWAGVAAYVETLTVPPVACIVDRAEVAAFDDLRESSGGFYTLGGGGAEVE